MQFFIEMYRVLWYLLIKRYPYNWHYYKIPANVIFSKDYLTICITYYDIIYLAHPLEDLRSKKIN